MPAADTGLAKARHVFTKHGGMLSTANAIRLRSAASVITTNIRPSRVAAAAEVRR